MQGKNIDGIIYFEKPYSVDFIDFGYAHLDCDSIITLESSDSDEIEVVCYASEPKYNKTLREIFNSSYKNKGYCIMQHISSLEATSID